MPELLFEIGMEEMPARFVRPAMADLERLAAEEFTLARLAYRGLETTGTPRRLVLMVRQLDDRQPDVSETVAGPPMQAAFDKEGNPTKAALGFAKSQGVEVGDLGEVSTEKGPRLGFVKNVPGREASEVLAELLPRLVERLSFPKSMRWGSQKFRFARPIHWFLALADGKVVPFELANITSGDSTRGHRFLAPRPVAVSGIDDYLKKIEQAEVIVNRSTRKRLADAEIEVAAQTGGGHLVSDKELLEEVTDLVELPVACCGSFDEEFLEVPRPVIISAMRSHQRYFAMEDAGGKLLNKFVAVNNTRPKDLRVVTAGHEKVLRARLADARFFLTEDRKRPLIDRLEDLKQVTYHAKLGTSFDKVSRFTALAGFLAGELGLDAARTALVERAAKLAKCDLVTEMVGEFADLQGVVGAEYARRDGEDPAVAAAVEEHYLPAGAGSRLPEGQVGVLVGLADRIDTICGCFGVGLIPSGAADPFGLRRAAIGVIRLATEKGLTLSLDRLLAASLSNLKPWLERPAEDVAGDVRDFFAARLTGVLAEQGVPTDVTQAVLAAGFDDLTAAAARARALARMKASDEFAPLAAGLKRVMNILRKEAEQVTGRAVNPDLMDITAEKDLYRRFGELEAQARECFAAGEYLAFLEGLVALKGPIDRFFDDVMVMVDDPEVRANRLALLDHIAGLFRQLAEFTYLQLA